MKYINKYSEFLSESKNDPIPELNQKEKLGIILLGAPGIGKSTFAKQFIRNQTIKTFSTDDISLMFSKDPNVYHKGSSELNITKLKKFMETGHSFIYDTTGTQEENVKEVHTLAKFNGYTTIFIHVIGPLDTAVKQNLSRERQVPEDYIKMVYDRQFGNISKYSSELHPDAYYIVQNISGKYKFSKYDSGKILRRKVDRYVESVESPKDELDLEMMQFILDDIIDDFGGENITIKGINDKIIKADEFSDKEKTGSIKLSVDIYNARRFKFLVVVKLDSDYEKFSKLISDFNSCVKRIEGYGWIMKKINVVTDYYTVKNTKISSVHFEFDKPEEEIKGVVFDEDNMIEIIEVAFSENGLSVTDYEFKQSNRGEYECSLDFDSKSYDGEMPENMGDVIADIEDRIGATSSELNLRNAHASFTWHNWI